MMQLISVESPVDMHDHLEQLLAATSPRRVLVVTGAGISVASGLPTYRGEDGYWTEDSANYEPQEVGYLSTFRARPRHVWRRSLYMRGQCLAAEPNPAHVALAQLEAALGDDFLLVTQNVDGLHLRAGNSSARTVEAHGSIHRMRALDGGPALYPIPPDITLATRDGDLSEAQWEQLRTPAGGPARPHAMFFDEPYEEAVYRTDTALTAADACDLIVVIGTSGATGLPWSACIRALEADAAIITIDPQDSPFASHAHNRGRAGKGLWLRGTASEWVPVLAERLLAVRERGRERGRDRESNREPPASVRGPDASPPRFTPTTLCALRQPGEPGYASSHALAELLAARPPRRVVVLTGAGISAESGIPTFRGAGGRWTTRPGGLPVAHDEFETDPRASWAYHLRRRSESAAASPNDAHLALAALDRSLAADLCLITQNIDSLHLRAGNDPERVIELHGSLERMRAVDGDPLAAPIPAGVVAPSSDGAPLSDQSWALLRMPDGSPARPHVLWWNEPYNEVQYRSESALAAAAACDLLVVIGTSGSAAMPYAIAAQAVLTADATLIDIDPEDNAYAEHARDRAADGKGLWLQGAACRWVPELVSLLLRLRADG